MKVLQFGMSSNGGGVESFIINYNKEIVKYGITYDYISMEDTIAYSKKIEELGGRIIHIPYSNKHPIQSFFALCKVTKEYDIIHVNMLCAANILPLIAARINGVKKIISHSHNTNTEGILRKLLHNINKAFLTELATDYVACGDAAARWLFPRKIIDNNRYSLIYNAIDIEKFEFSEEKRMEIRSEFRISNDTLLLGCVGRITLQKNIVFIIEVLEKIISKRNNTKLILVGNLESGYGKSVMEKINELNLSDFVIFAGERMDVNKFYSAFDVFCMPSLYEGLSYTAIESQVSNVKCIFSDKMDKECMIVPDVSFIGIDNADTWAELIASYQPKCRDIDNTALFIERGYDLKKAAHELYALYQRDDTI
jgi:glycosyltransferase involved in cell wall biosynthesis